jgi:hypothetical protein
MRIVIAFLLTTFLAACAQQNSLKQPLKNYDVFPNRQDGNPQAN